MKTILSLKGQFDIFVLSPVPHVHIESGTAFRTVFVGNLDTAHHDDASLRLCSDLIGHVEIKRRQVFPVLQAYFKYALQLEVRLKNGGRYFPFFRRTSSCRAYLRSEARAV